jgi:hypothetical protein
MVKDVMHITAGYVVAEIETGSLRKDFVTRARIQYASDEEFLEWLGRPNGYHHGRTPWEVFTTSRDAQGAFLDATCKILCRCENKRSPEDLPPLVEA